MRLTVLFAALFALASCATTAPVRPEPVYYVMRHLHTPAGERDPDLTAEGQRQAALLHSVLREQPRVIYVSTFKRTQQT
ncbi:MAG: histidine phosphatase family protein, partial [Pseudomonadota bacterium]|nr:histidine phosphatase family protein [Pseudomonadota bacterium]